MKKILLSVALLTAGLLSQAQIVKVGKYEKVNLPEGTIVTEPTISPDGTFVVYSQHANNALDCVDLSSGKVNRLTNNGSSYNLTITEDGSNVIFRQRTINKKGLSYTAVKSVSRNGGNEATLVKPSRNLEGISVNGTTVSTVENRKARTKNLGSVKAQNNVTASIDRGHLNITVNGKTTTIDPQGKGSYLWPVVSPDGKKVAYYLAYRGCFVADIDGSNAVSLGELRAPKWLDNNVLIGMLDRDNGEYLTSSALLAKTADGKLTQVLTPSEIIAVYPSASADGSKVAFATEKGELYILNLSK